MASPDLLPLDDWVPADLLGALRRCAAGRRLHLVGGALRDRRLGRVAPDFDLVVDGGGEEIGRRLADLLGGRFVMMAGERFAAYRVVAPPWVLDLWGRGDLPLRDELGRRDLTINAVAVAIGGRGAGAERGPIDPFDGIGDLDRRILRATTPGVFQDDPLRVLRLARFAAVLDGFGVDPDTLELARRAAPGIEAVAVERVREEVGKILGAAGRARGLEVLAACGLYPRLWDGDTDSSGRRAGPLLAEIEPTADQLLSAVGAELAELDPVPLAHALLFSLAGGGAAAAGASPLLTRRERPRITRLLEQEVLPSDEPARRWFLRRWGRRWPEAALFSILRAPDGGATETTRAHALAELARHHGDAIFELAPLLDGSRIRELLGIAPGPEVGRAVAALEREQVAGRVRNRDEAGAFLRDWWERRRPKD